ncbi:MAG TPA: isochorismatase family protein [Stellaceae bacterium]|nr:isochorismatase family protein [Stellaceae bacterium]
MSMWDRRLAAAALVSIGLAAGFAASAAQAGTIIDDWSKVKVEPAPQLKEVTVDPKTTALLMLDFIPPICNEKVRPRCVASLPAMKQMLERARTAHATVIFSTAGKATPKDIWAQIAPLPSEPWVHAHADKFIDTDLDKILHEKGIKTVIVVGTAANGAVLYTGSHAALLGYKVIVPVDGSTAENEYVEQYVVYNFAHAPGVASNTTLTTSERVKF